MSGQPLDGRRRWWRSRSISLRLSLVFVLAIALALGWVAHLVREQRQVKEMILRHDGLFYYEFEPPTVTRYTRKSWLPAWLRRAIDEEYFHDVTWVRIEGVRFGDAELERLRVLDRIETLGLVETAITDAGLHHLRGRKALKGLFLGGNWIGDAGLDALDLASIPQLEVLELRSTLVTKARLAEIKRRFPKLLILDDGPSHRYIVPGQGRSGDRMVRPDQVRGARRKVPAPRHHDRD